jgi:hypothetical protein
MTRRLGPAVIILLVAVSPARGGDVPARAHRATPVAQGATPVAPLDFTPPSLSGTVLASDACWRGCAATCSAKFNACTRVTALNDCRARSDDCDLVCLKSCRGYGGPFLDITDSGP